MFQDIDPKKFRIEYKNIRPDGSEFALVYQKGCVLMHKESEILPTVNELIQAGFSSDDFQYAFAIDEKIGDGIGIVNEDGIEKYFVYIGREIPEKLPEDLEFIPAFHARQTPGKSDDVIYAIGMGKQLSDWYQKNRFCGRCGAPMGLSEIERAHICPNCGNLVYPRISPVVIVGVTDGNRLLLTKYADRPFKGYALVAGFMELGETPEDTVVREVYEETGLKVRNVRYYGSQPWPYPDSLLLGFYADVYDSTEVHLLDGELKEGIWFERQDVPQQASRLALTANMIEDFRLGIK